MLGYYIWITKHNKVLRTTVVLVFPKDNVPEADRGKLQQENLLYLQSSNGYVTNRCFLFQVRTLKQNSI